jgi:hypothetical protein
MHGFDMLAPRSLRLHKLRLRPGVGRAELGGLRGVLPFRQCRDQADLQAPTAARHQRRHQSTEPATEREAREARENKQVVWGHASQPPRFEPQRLQRGRVDD